MSNTIPDAFKPPMQNAPGVFTTNADGCSPFYRFVSICNSQDGIEVWESLPTMQAAEYDGETHIENVIQTYVVHIPYTTEIDGEPVTKYRTEHRTRTVPVRKRKQPDDTDKKLVEHAYTVSIPYTEIVDGIAVTRTRLETRTRLVPENEIPINLVPFQQSKSYCHQDVRFYDIDGKEISAAEVLGSLEPYTPVIQIADRDHIVPYFSQILKPTMLFMVVNSHLPTDS